MILKYFPKKNSKGAPLCASPNMYSKASLTVEASMALPLFIFMCMYFLYLFIGVSNQLKTRVDLYSAVSEMAVLGFAEDSDAEKYAELTVPVYNDIPVYTFGNQSFLVIENFKMRKWTGYDPNETSASDAEEMVYIAKEGTVYHRDRGCSYLNPSIRTVSRASLKNKRNSSGHIYYECRSCKPGKYKGDNVYITTYGESYHCSLGCEGLKRTIYCVPISEALGRRACSKCG